MVVAEVAERPDAVVLGGQHEQLLARLALGRTRHRQRRGGDHALGDVVDAGEVARAPAGADTSVVEQRFEGDLAVVVVPPRALLADPLLEVAGDDRAVLGHVLVDRLDVVGTLGHQLPERRPAVRLTHPPPVEVVLVGRNQAGLVHPVLEQLAGGTGVVDQRARVRAEPGEQRQLLAANQHVDRVDLDQSDPVEQASEVAPIDTPGRPPVGEALCSERDPARLCTRQRDSRSRRGRHRSAAAGPVRVSRRRRS